MHIFSRVRRHVGVIAAAIAPLVVAGAFSMPGAHATGGSTISGAVWNDANRNGVFDSGESPFANTAIDVYSGSTFVTGAITDANGNYSVGGLTDGTYTVEIHGPSWGSMMNNWVPTTTGGLSAQITLTLSGTATANFGLRQIVRSTTMSSPISSYQGPNGFTVHSYDDVLTAQALYNDLASGQLIGPEAHLSTLYFDSSTSSDTTTSEAGGPGSYSNFTADLYVSYGSWTAEGDETLFHEYGHAWSLYNAYIVQQDPTLTSYLQARGLYGNPNLGTSWSWEPTEIFAEDYRQLFGTPNAASYAQANTQIPPASQVPGLKSFLQSTYDQPPSSQPSVQPSSTQPAPTVTGVSPATVPSSGGQQVTVTGTNFSGSGWTTTAVHVGGTAASFSAVSSTQLSVTLPPGTGQQDLTVTTTSSSAGATETSSVSSGDVVTYVAVPTVTSISPTSGSARGGTTVTVYGSGFSGPGFTATVSFGGAAGSKVTVVSPTQLTVVSPATSSSGTVDVRVATPGGTSATSSADQFSYTKKR